MVRFTKHAEEKFNLLKQHGVEITRQQVIAAVAKPKLIDISRLPLYIAQADLDQKHVLRVVYKIKNTDKIIITFYPGRKRQYAK